MRPKIVILTLVVAVGLVALAAVLKGLSGKPGGNEAQAPPIAESNKEVTPAPVVAANPDSSNTTAITSQLRAAEVAKQVEQIQDLATDSSAGPTAVGIIVGKVTDREPEVRKAAVQALVQMNDTNAVPGMEAAVALIEDPREKVALMDAIAYLKLPSAMPETPPSDLPAAGAPGSPSDPALEAAIMAQHGKAHAGGRQSPRAQAPGPNGIPAPPPAQAQPQIPGSAPQ